MNGVKRPELCEKEKKSVRRKGAERGSEPTKKADDG